MKSTDRSHYSKHSSYFQHELLHEQNVPEARQQTDVMDDKYFEQEPRNAGGLADSGEVEITDRSET